MCSRTTRGGCNEPQVILRRVFFTAGIRVKSIKPTLCDCRAIAMRLMASSCCCQVISNIARFWCSESQDQIFCLSWSFSQKKKPPKEQGRIAPGRHKGGPIRHRHQLRAIAHLD
jgi:hypothetical protein